jgi:hypothetical protein
MSMCRSRRGPKVGHELRADAEAHLQRHQRSTKHLCQVYRCPKCGLWHVGRKPAGKRWHQSKRAEKSVDERLVGQLVAILRQRGWN